MIELSAVLDLAEMGAPQGLRGRIVSVGPAPQIEDGPGRVVTTTVNHLNSFVFELTLRKADGRIDTLGVTGYHRFFDEADGWQQVVELQLGDVLRTQSGRVEVLAIQRLDGTHRVYNLTVEADHVYYVGDFSTLAHNVCPVTPGEGGSFRSLNARRVAGDGITPHHMPQAALGFTPYEEGGALSLMYKDHVLTRTFGTRGAASAVSDAGRPFRQVLAADIRDVRNLLQLRYGDRTLCNHGIRGVLEYYRAEFPDLITKLKK